MNQAIPGGLQGPDGYPYDQIRLTGLSATGYHGVYDHERRDGQVFRADVVLHVDTRDAAVGDDLGATTSYAEVAEDVVAVLEGAPSELIETVAERIAATVLMHPGVEGIDVVVHKPEAPISVPFEDAAVAIRRDRLVRFPVVAPLVRRAPVEDEHPMPHAAADDVPLGTAAAVLGLATTGTLAHPEPVVHTPAIEQPVVAEVPAAPVPAAPVPVAPVPAAPVPAAVELEVETTPAEASQVGVEQQPEPEPATDVFDRTPDGFVDIVLALGANLDDPQTTLRRAVTDIDRISGVELTEVAPLARTAAVGGPEQPDFLNTVLLGRTTLSARELLHACQGVERAHGRERHEHWGPRTLDVDIVVYGSVVAEADDLAVPHPRANERAFVLEPWAQVAPEAVLPGLGGGQVRALAATAPDRTGIRWLALDWLGDPAAPVETSVAPEAPTAPEDGDHPAGHATPDASPEGIEPPAHEASAAPAGYDTVEPGVVDEPTYQGPEHTEPVEPHEPPPAHVQTADADPYGEPGHAARDQVADGTEIDGPPTFQPASFAPAHAVPPEVHQPPVDVAQTAPAAPLVDTHPVTAPAPVVAAVSVPVPATVPATVPSVGAPVAVASVPDLLGAPAPVAAAPPVERRSEHVEFRRPRVEETYVPETAAARREPEPVRDPWQQPAVYVPEHVPAAPAAPRPVAHQASFAAQVTVEPSHHTAPSSSYTVTNPGATLDPAPVRWAPTTGSTPVHAAPPVQAAPPVHATPPPTASTPFAPVRRSIRDGQRSIEDAAPSTDGRDPAQGEPSAPPPPLW